MATVQLYTFHDIYEHLMDYLGSVADPEGKDGRACKRAIIHAWREFGGLHDWRYYTRRYRISTSPSYSTGTITYDHTGGAYERQLTLATGTWPSDAEDGTVVISNVQYRVATRESDTVVTLDPILNPGADIAAGTAYTWYRYSYPCPSDMIWMNQPTDIDRIFMPAYVPPDQWMRLFRSNQEAGTPWAFTIMEDVNYQGILAVHFWNPPDAQYDYDFIYKRRPRDLLRLDINAGTVATTADSATITGSGTNWKSSMIGSIIRFTDSTSTLPTGVEGSNPYLYERVVVNVASDTSLTVDATMPETLSGVKYRISDPIDCENGSMMSCFVRLCEHNINIFRRKDGVEQSLGLFQKSLIGAREADAVVQVSRQAGISDAEDWAQWMRRSALGSDVE